VALAARTDADAEPRAPEEPRAAPAPGEPRRRPALALPTLRIGVLQWAVGAFCAIIGALTFITPHQYAGPSYGLLRPYLSAWGVLCLVGGAALYAVALLAPRRPLVWAAHLLAAVPVVLLGASALAAGGLTGFTVYSVLGVGTALAPLFAGGASAQVARRDLFAVLVGTGAILNGAIMLAAPGQYSSVIFDPVRPYLTLYGAAFLLGGLGTVWTQLRTSAPTGLLWASHLLLAAGLSAFGPPVSWPNRAFTSIAYYNGFGLLVALLPWLRPRLRRAEPRSLRTVLALAFGLVASAPLVLTVALVTDQVERSARAEALARQEVLAEALAQGVGDYVGLHRAAAAALAAQPGLLARDPDARRDVVRAFAATYPDAHGFALYDAEGRLLAASDERDGQPDDRPPLFEEVRRTERPALRIVPMAGPPGAAGGLVFAVGEPIRDGAGRFAGMAAVAIESTRLSEVLRRASVGPGGQVYLVDADGRLIADGDAARQAARPELATAPPVARLRAGDGTAALAYGEPNVERLAGVARVPDLGWGVVVERSAAAALAGARAGRDLAFAILLLMIGLAVLAGALLAGIVAAPLRGLAVAVDALAAGASAAPLPRSRLSEVARLAGAFGGLRDRLAARTAERERAERRLRFLADASAQLAGSLEYGVTLERVARLAVPTIADWCFVDVLDEDGGIRRVEVAHADPARAPEAAILRRYPPRPDMAEGIAKVLRTGVSELIPRFPAPLLPRIAVDAEHLRAVQSLGVRSCMRVPLIARGRTLGVISFLTTDSGRDYGAADLTLAEDLGRRCAVAIDNARLYEESQGAIRARDEFLSIASHELRTPVTGIKGYAQILLRAEARGQLDRERLRRSLATINEATDRLTALTSDLLDVSRIRTGQLPLRLERVDLAELLRGIVGRYRDQLDGRHRLVAAIPDGPVPADADPGRLDQVLTNLLNNAIKYSPDGGEVRILLAPRDGGTLIEVADQGIGLPADASEAIFQPFGRAPNAARRSLPGMGLGLYICRTIVERHGGRIWAASDGEDRGTTFGLWLPARDAEPVVGASA
jgi:signal transduction histidine kinase